MENINQFIHYIILRLGYPIALTIIKLATYAFDQTHHRSNRQHWIERYWKVKDRIKIQFELMIEFSIPCFQVIKLLRTSSHKSSWIIQRENSMSTKNLTSIDIYK